MAYLREVDVNISDGAADGFGRLPVASPTAIYDAQFTYDLQPLLYEPLTNGSGATVTHDSTNRRAKLSFSSTATGGYAFMQSYEYFRYQPGKAQQIFMSFVFGASVSGVTKIAQYGDNDCAYRFGESAGDLYFEIIANTAAGDQNAVQDDWNIDKLDGTGESGKTIDITKAQILVIDFQALYSGRVRFGFDIDGRIIWAHEFLTANNLEYPYIQTANLPVKIGMQTSSTVTCDMYFHCCSVLSSGGVDETLGYEFSTPDVSVTAGSATRTHLMSIRPRTTFNSITNRIKVAIIEINIIVTGSNSVFWELCLGQGFSVAPTYSNVNATYSSVDYGTGGTMSGSPSILVDSGYVSATASSKSTTQMTLTSRYPITLDAAGAVRSLGTLSLVVTGLSGTSATRGTIKFKEIR